MFRRAAETPSALPSGSGWSWGHPACDDTVTDEANAVLARLRTRLPPDRLEAALARGRALKLEAV